MTVPPSARIAAFISARCVLSMPASTVGSTRSAMPGVAAHVRHQHRDDRAARSRPICVPVAAQLLGEPAREQPAQRLALLLAVDDRLLQQPQPAQRALAPGARFLRELEEQVFDRVVRRFGGRAATPTAIAFTGRPSAIHCEQLVLALVELAVGARRRDERVARSRGRACCRRSRPRGPRGTSWSPSPTRSFSRYA